LEHKIFNKIRKYKIPLFLRTIIMIFFVILWLFLVLLPIPWSALFWWWIVILWFIFILEARHIANVIKIRKWLFYFMKNYKNKKIRSHKIKDIKKHIKNIIKK